MENTVPVSDMRFYNQTLSDVSEGSQVILTKNGKAKYAVVDFEEWQFMQAKLRLLQELEKGRQSLRTEPHVSREEFRKHFGIVE